MAKANVDKKPEVKTVSDKPSVSSGKRGATWQRQPSVLKPSRFKIGDGEDDFVD